MWHCIDYEKDTLILWNLKQEGTVSLVWPHLGEHASGDSDFCSSVWIRNDYESAVGIELGDKNKF